MAVWSNPAKNVPANTGSGHLKLCKIQQIMKWTEFEATLYWNENQHIELLYKLECSMYLHQH